MSADIPTLLITGCIAPDKKQGHLYICDSKQRFEQYIFSIKYYIKDTMFNKIVFCENSNFIYPTETGLLELAESVGKKFEWLCFMGNSEEVIKKGKGFGEGEIIEYAINHSNIMRESSWFIKTTGRIIVKNVNEILLKLEYRRNYFNRDVCRTCGIDTRFYCCTKDFYICNLLSVYKLCSDYEVEMSLEDIFYDSLHRNKFYACLPYYPFFSGVGGSHGDDYDRRFKVRKYFFSFMCKLSIFNSVQDFVFSVYRSIRTMLGYKGYRNR